MRNIIRFCLVVVIVCLLSLSSEARPRKRRVRRGMDPYRIEQIFTKLSRRTPLPDQEWKRILGDKKASTYSIVAGDTLWSIATKALGNPFLWRKLWQENPYLTNPHDLTPGQVLSYYKGPTRELASEAIPVVKLRPYGLTTDLDAGSFSQVVMKNHYRPMMLVLADDEPQLGEISGAYTVNEAMNELDHVYLDLEDPEKVMAREQFSVVHVERTLKDKSQTGAPVMGTLVRLVGEVTVLDMGEKFALARIDSAFERIRRGDKLIPILRTTEPSPHLDPPNHLQARIVMGEDDELTSFGQGQLILLNKGLGDGMQKGFYFRVYQDVDPNTESDSRIDPGYKGEVQVIYAGKLSSLGYIVRNSEPLYIGDTLIPRQAFPDPEPIPRREVQSFEIR